MVLVVVRVCVGYGCLLLWGVAWRGLLLVGWLLLMLVVADTLLFAVCCCCCCCLFLLVPVVCCHVRCSLLLSVCSRCLLLVDCCLLLVGVCCGSLFVAACRCASLMVVDVLFGAIL